MSAQFGAGEAFQNDAESSGRDVEAAGLDPYTFGVRNLVAVMVDIDVGDEVPAAPLVRSEAVSETAEGSDRHVYSYENLES